MKKKCFMIGSFLISACFLSGGLHFFDATAVTVSSGDGVPQITKNQKSKRLKKKPVHSAALDEQTGEKLITHQERDVGKKNVTSFMETGGSIKEIEVNSVNFIRLKKKANEIFIPDPNVADVQMLNDKSLYLMGLEPGFTSLVVNDEDGNVILDYKIKVTYALKAIKEALAEMHPDSEVEIVSVDDSVVLRGRVSSPEVAADVQEIVGRFIESEKIINKLSIETSTQVLLKVKIAEVSRKVTKSLGISWRAFSQANSANGMHYGFMSNNTQLFPAIAATGTTGESTLATPAMQAADLLTKDGILSGNGGRWLMYNGGSSNLSGLIDALASETFASVLAEPTLVALSGKTATFKSGGEYAYVVTQQGTNSANTTEFKEWGTSIEFTPIVISEDRINITVTPKVSVPTSNGQDKAPSLNSKEATTTVELGSGQSMAIAGLLQRNTSSGGEETPFLSDIPLIGSLFRKSNVEREEKELVIVVTPYIVKPSSRLLKLPTDMLPRMFSPLESILNRRFHARVPKVNLSAGFSVK